MNKAGLIDIKKAYLGNKELSSNNAFVGDYPLIGGGTTYEGLKFKSIGNTTIGFNVGSYPLDMKYSLNNGITWTQWTYSDIILSNGNEICFKGNNPNGINSPNNSGHRFILYGNGTL